MPHRKTALHPLLTLRRGEEEAKTAVQYELFSLGRDLLLVVSGGRAHLGAIACTDQKELKEYGLSGHKEIEVIPELTRELGKVTDREILVIGGIHYDDITQEQIQAILAHMEEMTEELKTEVAALRLDFA